MSWGDPEQNTRKGSFTKSQLWSWISIDDVLKFRLMENWGTHKKGMDRRRGRREGRDEGGERGRCKVKFCDWKLKHKLWRAEICQSSASKMADDKWRDLFHYQDDSSIGKTAILILRKFLLIRLLLNEDLFQNGFLERVTNTVNLIFSALVLLNVPLFSSPLSVPRPPSLIDMHKC